uniref:Flavin-containing monooxygenase n=1 Tax=Bursaphelenchus xylophilus TaxID=6326 RepID=A0A1I7S692_BURXY
MEKTKRCAIIGGSISGLTSAKWAKEYGIEPVVFEATAHIGGLWLYKEEDGDLPTVMKSTVINSSKECAALSDYPPPAHSAPYMHHTKFYEYIVNYAKDNDVTQHVKLNHRVRNVHRAEDYKLSGQWNVEYTDGNGNEHHEVFDAVLSCVGHHTTPNWPREWPGQGGFRGRFSHAHSYKKPSGFEDKVVVVVGAGNSAMDIICELGRVSKQVYWSTRRGAWISPKCTDSGWPVDMALQRRIFYHLSKVAPWLMEKYVRDKHNRHLDHELYGIRPTHGVFNQHPTASDELPIRIASGLVLPCADIKSFGERSVEFVDGKVVEDVDEVVFATGYKFAFPFLENGKLVPVVENKCRLYKQMYPKDEDGKNTCAVIGLVQSRSKSPAAASRRKAMMGDSKAR